MTLAPTYKKGNNSKTTPKPRSAIIVQIAAIRPSPAPTAIQAVRATLKEVWVAISIAVPGLAIATIRTTLNVVSWAQVMFYLLGLSRSHYTQTEDKHRYQNVRFAR